MVAERVLSDNHRLDVEAGLEAEDVDGFQIGRVRHGDGERPAHLSEGQHQVLVGHFTADEPIDLLFDDDFLEIDSRQAVLLGEHPRELVLRHEAELHE